MPAGGGTDDSEVFVPGAGNFQYTGVDVSALQGGSTKYTLATIALDVSSSVEPFEATIEELLKEVVGACQKDPNCDTLLLRVILFSTGVTEIHGFKLLSAVNPADYTGTVKTGGCTALYDALLDASAATATAAEQLQAQCYMVNSVTFLVTDGHPYGGTHGASAVKTAKADLRAKELLAGDKGILLGLADIKDLTAFEAFLKGVAANTGCEETMVVENFSVGGPKVNKGKIANLAGFVSKSMSTTSQALQGIGAGSTSTAVLSLT